MNATRPERLFSSAPSAASISNGQEKTLISIPPDLDRCIVHGEVGNEADAVKYVLPEEKERMFHEFGILFSNKDTKAEDIKAEIEKRATFEHYPYYIVIEMLKKWMMQTSDFKILLRANEVVHLFVQENKRELQEVAYAFEDTVKTLKTDASAARKRLYDVLTLYLNPARGEEYFSTPQFASDIHDLLEKPEAQNHPSIVFDVLMELEHSLPQAVEAIDTISIEVGAEWEMHRELRSFFLSNKRAIRIESEACREELRRMKTSELAKQHPDALRRALNRLKKEYSFEKRWIEVMERMIVAD